MDTSRDAFGNQYTSQRKGRSSKGPAGALAACTWVRFRHSSSGDTHMREDTSVQSCSCPVGTMEVGGQEDTRCEQLAQESRLVGGGGD